MRNGIIFKVAAITLLFHCVNVNAQLKQAYLSVGDVFPKYTFYDVVNYPSKTVSTDDFRGKWLIIDFWGHSCSVCIGSFPKMSRLQKYFDDRVQVIMVGGTKFDSKQESEPVAAKTKDLYHRLEKRNGGHHFAAAFDSVLFLKYDIGALPHIYIIDPGGTIRVKTTSVDSLQLSQLLDGKKPYFRPAFSSSEKKPSDAYNMSIPFLTNGVAANGGIDTSFLFRSLLTLATAKTEFRIVDLFRNKNYVENGGFDAFNFSLEDLYRLAFFGKSLWSNFDSIYHKTSGTIIWNVADTSQLRKTKEQKFSYSLHVPKYKSTRKFLMSAMQSDLKNYFQYNASIQKRMMPVYVLKISDQKKFRKFISQNFDTITIDATKSRMKFMCKDVPMSFCLRRLEGLLHLDQPLVDSTGMVGKVNIYMPVDYLIEGELERKLKENGLIIDSSSLEMEAIVISDESGKEL